MRSAPSATDGAAGCASKSRALAATLVLLVGISAMTAGCQPTRYVGLERTEPDVPRLAVPVGGRDPGLRTFYMWGFLPRVQKVHADSICGAPGIAEVRTERSWGHIFLYVLSVGVFAPYDAEVTCGPPAPPPADPATAPAAAP